MGVHMLHNNKKYAENQIASINYAEAKGFQLCLLISQQQILNEHLHVNHDTCWCINL